MKKKIAILGTAPSWHDAPFSDKDWEIWVCNRAGLSQKPWDKLFEIHYNLDYENAQAKEKYIKALQDVKKPQQVISVMEIGGEANLVINRDLLFSRYGAVWMSSSFGYMLAYALDQKPVEIGLWGVDMESREELHTQFYGVRHFMDIARERAIKVTVPERSALNREPHPYPDRFETALAYKLEENCARAVKLIEKAEIQLETAKQQMNYYNGRAYQANRGDDEYAVKYLGEEAKDWEVVAHRYDKAVNRLKGELWASQQIRRLFVFNILPPDIGEETDSDTENSGPT